MHTYLIAHAAKTRDPDRVVNVAQTAITAKDSARALREFEQRFPQRKRLSFGRRGEA